MEEIENIFGEEIVFLKRMSEESEEENQSFSGELDEGVAALGEAFSGNGDYPCEQPSGTAEAEDAADATPAEDTAEQPENQEQPDDTAYRYKYNHNTVLLDKKAVGELAGALGRTGEDVIAQLQKGEDYDRKTEQLHTMRQMYGGVIGRIEDIARERNVPLKDAAEMFADMANRTEVFNRAERMMRENPGLSLQSAKRLAEGEAGHPGREDRTVRIERDFNRQWENFFSRHPELVKDPLPDEITDYFIEGYTPEEAYARYQADRQGAKLRALERRFQMMEQAGENRRTSPGSLRGQGADRKTDPFLEGLRSIL